MMLLVEFSEHNEIKEGRYNIDEFKNLVLKLDEEHKKEDGYYKTYFALLNMETKTFTFNRIDIGDGNMEQRLNEIF